MAEHDRHAHARASHLGVVVLDVVVLRFVFEDVEEAALRAARVGCILGAVGVVGPGEDPEAVLCAIHQLERPVDQGRLIDRSSEEERKRTTTAQKNQRKRQEEGECLKKNNN